MELQHDEDSTEPSFAPKRKSDPRISKCNTMLTVKIVIIVLLIVVSFMAGYLVRRAIYQVKSNANADRECQYKSPKTLDETPLQEMLSNLSPKSIEATLRYRLIHYFIIMSFVFATKSVFFANFLLVRCAT